MFSFDIRLNGLRETLLGLKRVETLIRRGKSDLIGRRIGKHGVKIVEKLTPRQHNKRRAPWTRRGFPPFHKQWTLIEKVARSNVYMAVIRNKATMAAGGMDRNEAVAALMALEFGARPHVIKPRRAGGRLSWWRQANMRMFVARESDQTRPPALRGSNLIADSIFRRRGESGTAFAKKVNHPGHEAFRMVQETRLILDTVAVRVLNDFADQIARVFGKGFNISVR